MSVPPSIKRPSGKGLGFRLEDARRSETRPAIYTKEVELDLDPGRQFGQSPAYDGLLSRRGGPSRAILVDPRLYPFPQEVDDFFWQLDASRPWVAFSKPTGNLAAYLGIPGADARALYNFEQTNGFFTDLVSNAHLTASAGVLTDRPCVGLWNGTDFTSVRSCEFPDIAGTGSSVGSNSMLDVGNSSVAMICVWRNANTDDTDAFGGAGKWNGSLTRGWGFYFITNDAVNVEFADTLGNRDTRTLTGVRDGAYHYLVMAFSRASSSITAYMDHSRPGQAAVSFGSSLDSGVPFCVGKESTEALKPFEFLPFTTTGHWQPLWLAVLTGSGAEAVFHASGAMDSWWGTVMNRSVPGMTYSRDRCAGEVIGYVPGTGSIMSIFAQNEVEFAYVPSFNTDTKLGVVARGFALPRQMGDSTFVSGSILRWTMTGSTSVPRVVDCPRGLRNGTVFHKTAVSGCAYRDITAGSENYFSVFVRRSGSAVPRIRLVTAAGGVLRHEIVCSGSLENEWRNYSITFGSTTDRVELHPSHPDDASGSACFQYACHYDAITGFPTGSEHIVLPTTSLNAVNGNQKIVLQTTGGVVFDDFCEVDATFAVLSRGTGNSQTLWSNLRTGSDGRKVYASQSDGDIISEVRSTDATIRPPTMDVPYSLGTQAIVKLAWDSTGSFALGYVVTTSLGTTSSFGLSGSTQLTASVGGPPRVLDLGSGSAPQSVFASVKTYAKTKIM